MGFMKIEPKIDEKEFLRKAWISLAQEDVPIDVFETADFSEVNQDYYRIYSTSAMYDATWEGEIGNNRQEAYTDYETYYEKIPYTEYERKYNSSTNKYDQVPVTKYRQEERQRAVTKYRTVTDWHAGNGHHGGMAYFLGCVDEKVGFDDTRFSKDFSRNFCQSIPDDELAAMPDMEISSSMENAAYAEHVSQIKTNLMASLPGDCSKDISYRIQDYDIIDNTLIRIPEYTTEIEYNGSVYYKRAFPFGNITMTQARIYNPISIKSKVNELQATTREENKKRIVQMEENIWNKSKVLVLSTLGLLAASIVVSLFVKFLFLVIALFGAGVAMFILTKFSTKNIRSPMEKLTQSENDKAQRKCEEACNNYSAIQTQKIMEALNKKLASLGLEPATPKELDMA